MNRREFAALPFAALAASPGEKRLIVHADDAGMCHSVNAATTEAMAKGMVSSASIMVPCPWFSEFAEWARANPAMDVGLHLTLTSEWKHYRWRSVESPDRVKGLLDPDGYLWPGPRGVATHATAEEVAAELRAQIARARHFGVKFTHLDTHMGTLFARPDYFEVYTKLALEAGVPCMMPKPTPEAALEMQQYPITAAMLEAKEAAGMKLLDRLVTGVAGKDYEERRVSYRALLKTLKPGVTKLIIHLSKDDSEIRNVTGAWGYRWADFQFWTSAEAAELLAANQVKLMTYREFGR